MPDKMTIDVNDQRRKPYRRVIKTRPVTFTCQECGKETTIEQYPGGEPRYCWECFQTVQRRLNAERVRRFRERKKQAKG